MKNPLKKLKIYYSPLFFTLVLHRSVNNFQSTVKVLYDKICHNSLPLLGIKFIKTYQVIARNVKIVSCTIMETIVNKLYENM